MKAERFPLNFGIGLCQGMMPIAGYNYAAKNHKRMKEVLNFSRFVGVAVGIISIIVYEVFAVQIMHAFIPDAETVQIGSQFLRIRCIATPLMFMCFHFVNFFQAIGWGRTSLVLAVSRWVVFNIPMLFILNALIGRQGIVWSQFWADVLTVAFSFVIYLKVAKKLAESQKQIG